MCLLCIRLVPVQSGPGVCVCVCACVHACMRACVRVRACVCVRLVPVQSGLGGLGVRDAEVEACARWHGCWAERHLPGVAGQLHCLHLGVYVGGVGWRHFCKGNGTCL